MDRRDFIKFAGIMLAALNMPKISFAQTKKANAVTEITKADIEKLLRCRALIDKYRSGVPYKTKDERSRATIAMNEGLLIEGFNGASAFSKWNDTLNRSEFRRCVPIEGSCDGCNGLPVPRCVEVFGAAACFPQRPLVANDSIYGAWFRDEKRLTVTKDGKTKFCPGAGGFYVVDSKRKTPQFDYGWRV